MNLTLPKALAETPWVVPPGGLWWEVSVGYRSRTVSAMWTFTNLLARLFL